MSMMQWPAAAGTSFNAAAEAGRQHPGSVFGMPSPRRSHEERLTRVEPFASRAGGTLVDAVAGIVAIAAQRARQAGSLDALRQELSRILEESGSEDLLDPREAGVPDLPSIDDAVTPLEVERLGILQRRQNAD
jgi:hypothetical protein